MREIKCVYVREREWTAGLAVRDVVGKAMEHFDTSSRSAMVLTHHCPGREGEREGWRRGREEWRERGEVRVRAEKEGRKEDETRGETKRRKIGNIKE